MSQIFDEGNLIFAQALPNGPAVPAREVSLELRRWLVSQTLSGPDSVESLRWGLLCWGGGLLGLLLLVIAAQGPRKALSQLFDAKGLTELIAATGARFRRAGRLLVVLFGALVVSWTGAQTLAFLHDMNAAAPAVERTVVAPAPAQSTAMTKRSATSIPPPPLNEQQAAAEQAALDQAVAQTAEVKASTKLGGPGSRAREQAVLAAMNPWAALCNLGDLTALAILAGVVAFQFSADQSGRRRNLADLKVGSRSMCAWVAAMLYALVRIVAWVGGRQGLPLRGCLPGEELLIPTLMLITDGFLLAWVLTELRNAGLAGPDGSGLDRGGASLLLPAAAACCLLLLPGRAAGLMIWQHDAPPKVSEEDMGYTTYSPAPSFPSRPQYQPLVSDEALLRGLVVAQGASVLFCGLLGSTAWGRGGLLGLFPNYWRLLRGQGGRLVALAIATGGAAGALAWLAHRIMLTLPPQPWTLLAADAYSHYAGTAVALVFAGGCIELGSRVLPTAALAPRRGAENGAGHAGEFVFLEEGAPA